MISHLGLCESGEVRRQVEYDTFSGSGQGDASEEQDDEHKVGEQRGEVHNLNKMDRNK